MGRVGRSIPARPSTKRLPAATRTQPRSVSLSPGCDPASGHAGKADGARRVMSRSARPGESHEPVHRLPLDLSAPSLRDRHVHARPPGRGRGRPGVRARADRRRPARERPYGPARGHGVPARPRPRGLPARGDRDRRARHGRRLAAARVRDLRRAGRGQRPGVHRSPADAARHHPAHRAPGARRAAAGHRPGARSPIRGDGRDVGDRRRPARSPLRRRPGAGPRDPPRRAGPRARRPGARQARARARRSSRRPQLRPDRPRERDTRRRSRRWRTWPGGCPTRCT